MCKPDGTVKQSSKILSNINNFIVTVDSKNSYPLGVMKQRWGKYIYIYIQTNRKHNYNRWKFIEDQYPYFAI